MTSGVRPLRFSVHRMTPDDVPEVAEIERTHQLEPWSASAFREELDKVHALCFVARLDTAGAEGRPLGRGRCETRVVGYVCVWIVVDEVQILTLAVHRDCWRKGVARALLDRTFREARKRGCVRATLEVRPSNAQALALYGSMGFRRAGERPGFYAVGGEPAVIMILDLGSNGKDT